MRIRIIGIAATATTLCSATASAQQPVPVRDLGPVIAKTAETIWLMMNVRQFNDGRVLVSDGAKRRLLLFDSTLAQATVVADTLGTTSFNYGRGAATLVPYVGDSVLFTDFPSQSLLVLNSLGAVIRVTAPPKASDLVNIRNSTVGADVRGRIVYRGTPTLPPRAPGAPPPPQADSIPIVRGDFATRKVDTLGMLGRPGDSPPTMPVMGADGKTTFKMVINPVVFVDDWTMNADGAIAILRAHDYHIDWIDPDGTRRSSPKLPFDRRRMTDEDKLKVIDSTRKVFEAFDLGGRGGMTLPEAQGRGLSEQALRVIVNSDGSKTVPVTLEFVPLNQIPDYMPPTRGGSMSADRDGNIWILPLTSAQSRKGGLVYDVVNRAGELSERVEVPVGRSVVGFGRGGIVYLMSGDRTKGFMLERARMR
jgi:hypothetical protein